MVEKLVSIKTFSLVLRLMSDGPAPTEPGISYSLMDFEACGSCTRVQTIGSETDGSGAIQLPSRAAKLPDQ